MATVLDRGLERDAPPELQVVGTKRRRGSLDRALLYILLIALAAFFILPAVIVLSTSFKFRTEVFTDPGSSLASQAWRTTCDS